MPSFAEGKRRERVISYGDLSRKRKRESLIRARNLVRKSPRVFAACEDYRIQPEFQWSDIVFLSRRYPLVWHNACVVSIITRYMDSIGRASWDNVEAVCAEHGKTICDMSEMRFVPDGRGRGHRMELVADPVPWLGGKTVFEALDAERERLLDSPESNGIQLRAGFFPDFGYAAGVGLDIVVDADWLDAGIVEKAVIEFLDGGEVERVGGVVPNPSRERVEKVLKRPLPGSGKEK